MSFLNKTLSVAAGALATGINSASDVLQEAASSGSEILREVRDRIDTTNDLDFDGQDQIAVGVHVDAIRRILRDNEFELDDYPIHDVIPDIEEHLCEIERACGITPPIVAQSGSGGGSGPVASAGMAG